MKHRSILFLAALAIVITGCNRSSGSGSNSGTTATGGAKLKIVYIPKNTGNPYFDQVIKGFQQASSEIGADFSTTAPATDDPTSQVPIIKSQIQNGVDVIAISPNSPDALNSVLDEAKAKGITVITVDADLVGNESHRDAAVLPADFSLIGPAQVELLGSLIGYEGDFAILSSSTTAPNQNAWIAKMKDALATNPKYAKMHLIDTVYGEDDPSKSTTACEGLIAAHPTLRGIIAPTSQGFPSCAQVVTIGGTYPGGPHAVGKGIVVTGLSTPNAIKSYIAKGTITAFQLWAPLNEGYIATYLGEQIHDKKLTPAAGATFKTPKFGDAKLTDKLEVIAGPLITFDKKNIGQYDY
jgi:rhamnose transport system substrate-binding protein